jgi:hypothetical protein
LIIKNLLSQLGKQESTEEKKHGGHNKETFMLSVKTFNLFCIKAVSLVLTPHAKGGAYYALPFILWIKRV